MPRPVSAARKPPWYKTTAGLTIAAIGSLLALILIIVVVSNVRSNNRETEARQEELETYTDQVEALVQKVREPVSAIAAAAAGAASGGEPPADAGDWVKQLDDAQTDLFQLIAPSGAAAANTIFQQSILTYRAAAKNFELAAEAEGKLASELQTQAATLSGSAGAMWESATAILDEEREDAGLSPSDIGSPSEAGAQQPPPQATPGVDVSIPPAEEDGGGGNDG